jgi:hypothetical protein
MTVFGETGGIGDEVFVVYFKEQSWLSFTVTDENC